MEVIQTDSPHLQKIVILFLYAGVARGSDFNDFKDHLNTEVPYYETEMQSFFTGLVLLESTNEVF